LAGCAKPQPAGLDSVKSGITILTKSTIDNFDMILPFIRLGLAKTETMGGKTMAANASIYSWVT